MSYFPPVAAGDPVLRVDQGVDYTAHGAVRAVGSGRITKISPPGSWAGGTGQAVYQLLDVPIRVGGRLYREVYYAEQAPLVRVGQRVRAGDPVMAAGSNELGFAAAGQPVATLQGGLGSGTKPTQAGYDFLSFVRGLFTHKTTMVTQTVGQRGASASDVFTQGVSQQTGVDPRVLVAWMRLENHPQGYNYLSLRSGPSSFAVYPNVQVAIQQTSALIKRIIGPLAGLSPRQAVARIAASPWDAGHYGGPGGPNLLRVFDGLFHGASGDRYQGPNTAPSVTATVGTGSASDAGSFDPSGKGKVHIPNPLAGIAGFFGKLGDPSFWVRALQVVGGGILAFAGLILLARQVGLSSKGAVT